MQRWGRYSTQKRIVFGAYITSVSYFPLTFTVSRCLAHIINLATQAFISTHSKSKHYDPAEPDADLTVDNGRDVVGLVRAISVKVSHPHFFTNNPSLTTHIQARSSAKRKQRFADLQKHANIMRIRQLLVDMPVRWSSTYVMTSRAESMSDVSKPLYYAICIH